MSANKSGEEYQEEIFKLLKTTNLSIDLMNVDSFNIDNIDAKKNFFKKLRKKITKLFLTKNDKLPYINYNSSIKGDIIIKGLVNIICDIKNYVNIDGRMKFPTNYGLTMNSFMKGVDSNIKYPIFYFFRNYENELSKLYIYFFLLKKNKFNTFTSKYETKETVCFLSKEKFIDLFCFVELGFGWKLHNISPVKYFLTKNGDKIQYKSIDFNKTLDDSNIRVDLLFENDYTYIFFYQNDECIYILSQRPTSANCSFINLNHIKILNELNIADYQTQIP